MKEGTVGELSSFWEHLVRRRKRVLDCFGDEACTALFGIPGSARPIRLHDSLHVYPESEEMYEELSPEGRDNVSGRHSVYVDHLRGKAVISSSREGKASFW